MNTPQLDDTVIFIGQISVAIIAIFGALALLNKFVFGRFKDDLSDIKKELHPNGGSSLRDAVNRLESTQSEIKDDIRQVRDKIDDHIEWHLDN